MNNTSIIQSFNKLEETVKKWLLIKDQGLLKILMATVIANKMKGDPVWLFIVAAPGATKTELLRALNDVPGVYYISSITANTFLSGDRENKNASLLKQLPEESIITIKDFTTVLTMHRDKRHEILSQFREIYDGYYRKNTGNGIALDWQGKMGVIAGVTSIIERHFGVYQTLGERFIQYRPIQPNEIDVSMAALQNNGYEQEMRTEIRQAVSEYISGITIPNERVAIPEPLQRKVANLAAFCVRARSTVIREGFSTRDIEFIPEIEIPTRLAKQLISLLAALMVISGDFLEEDYGLLIKVALDSLPQIRKSIILSLHKINDSTETSVVANTVNYPLTTTRRALEELSYLGIVNRDTTGRGVPDSWTLKPSIKELLEKSIDREEKLI